MMDWLHVNLSSKTARLEMKISFGERGKGILRGAFLKISARRVTSNHAGAQSREREEHLSRVSARVCAYGIIDTGELFFRTMPV